MGVSVSVGMVVGGENMGGEGGDGSDGGVSESWVLCGLWE